MDLGRWDEALRAAEAVIHDPRPSPVPRILALSVLGLIRARRGDPAHAAPLVEAWALAEPTGELQRLEPAVMARAEAAWLEGRHEEIAAITASEPVLQKVVRSLPVSSHTSAAHSPASGPGSSPAATRRSTASAAARAASAIT